MKKIVFILVGMVILLTSCNKYDKPVVENKKEHETGFYDILTDEQVKYIGFDEREINTYEYEVLNYFLYGSGYELYNKTDGTIANGITYTYDEHIDKDLYGKYYKDLKPSTDKRITLEEAYAICSKGQDMRVEDFLKYNFSILNIEDNINRIYLLVEGYGEESIYFRVEENKDGTVHMSIPLFDGISLITGKDWIYMRKKNEEEGNKHPFLVLLEGTLTGKSLAFEVFGFKQNEEYALDESFKLYKLKEDNTYEELKDYAYESEEICLVTHDYIVVEYATEENPLPAGSYKLEFGKNKEGYLYRELEFTIK